MIKNSLYYKDGYLKEFEAVVKECIEEDKKIKEGESTTVESNEVEE